MARMTGLDVVVFSRSLPATTAKGIRITKDDASDIVATLKKQAGTGHLALWWRRALPFAARRGARGHGGSGLMPVLIGSGIPLLPPGALARLELIDRKVLPGSGIVFLSYRVRGRRARGARIRYIKPRRKEARRTRSRKSGATR